MSRTNRTLARKDKDELYKLAQLIEILNMHFTRVCTRECPNQYVCTEKGKDNFETTSCETRSWEDKLFRLSADIRSLN